MFFVDLDVAMMFKLNIGVEIALKVEGQVADSRLCSGSRGCISATRACKYAVDFSGCDSAFR